MTDRVTYWAKEQRYNISLHDGDCVILEESELGVGWGDLGFFTHMDGLNFPSF